jgi:hypothetical protein
LHGFFLIKTARFQKYWFITIIVERIGTISTGDLLKQYQPGNSPSEKRSWERDDLIRRFSGSQPYSDGTGYNERKAPGCIFPLPKPKKGAPEPVLPSPGFYVGDISVRPAKDPRNLRKTHAVLHTFSGKR